MSNLPFRPLYNYSNNTFKTKEMLHQEYGIDITYLIIFAW